MIDLSNRLRKLPQALRERLSRRPDSGDADRHEGTSPMTQARTDDGLSRVGLWRTAQQLWERLRCLDRVSALACYGAIVPVLLISAFYAQSGLAAWWAAEQVKAQAERQLPQFQQQKVLLKRRQAYAREADRVLERVTSMKIDSRFWEKRSFRHARGLLPREEAVAVLDSVSNREGRVFVPDSYELSVTKPKQGLFQSPAHDEDQIKLQLRGMLYLRVQGATR